MPLVVLVAHVLGNRLHAFFSEHDMTHLINQTVVLNIVHCESFALELGPNGPQLIHPRLLAQHLQIRTRIARGFPHEFRHLWRLVQIAVHVKPQDF